MKKICIIPARGGSKRIPRKNIAVVSGKPLLAYAVEEAKKSELFERIVVSTEDNEIAGVAQEYGATVLMRSKKLATDTASVAQVCLDVLSNYSERGEDFDVLAILLPSSPLREAVHLKEAMEKFLLKDADYLMSTTDYTYSPFRALKENEDGFLEVFFGRQYLTQDQRNPHVVVHNGCIVLAKVKPFLRDRGYYGKKLIGYHMGPEASIDINEPIDLKLAEFFLNQKKNK